MDMAEMIKLASAEGAKVAIETVNSEKKKISKEWHDRRLRNTKLLLKNYRSLNEHINSAVFEQSKLEELEAESPQEILELMWESKNSEVVVNSIKRSVMRTKVIMTHVNTMLSLYETFCDKSPHEEDRRRWRVIKAMYISPEISTAEEIAKAENIEKRTVYRDVDKAIERISSLIFGIEGLKDI